MENRLTALGKNNIMDNFVKTDDILKDMCSIIESGISGSEYNSRTEKLAAWL